VEVGSQVTLDGSGSSDADGDPLTFQWSLVLPLPVGSEATLSDPTAELPDFTADVTGDYIAQLIVNDGTGDSEADAVTVTASPVAPPNTAPVADAGGDQDVEVGTEVILDGSASNDADADPLTFSWSLTTVPDGSGATLSDPTAAMPTFTPDLDGGYVAQLMVNDGTVDSDPNTVMVTATAPALDN
jgi:hypothetical protein